MAKDGMYGEPLSIICVLPEGIWRGGKHHPPNVVTHPAGTFTHDQVKWIRKDRNLRILTAEQIEEMGGGVDAVVFELREEIKGHEAEIEKLGTELETTKRELASTRRELTNAKKQLEAATKAGPEKPAGKDEGDGKATGDVAPTKNAGK